MNRLILNIACISLCLGIFLSGVTSAQEKGTSAKSVQRLNRAPVRKDVLQVKLPRPTEAKLSNGLTVLLLERHKLPTLNVSLWINAGSLYDPKDAPGLAKFTADMPGAIKAIRRLSELDFDHLLADTAMYLTYIGAIVVKRTV